MPHETSLIVAISAGLGLAFVLGTLASRLGLAPMLGYLLAGLAVGPFTPGIVADGAVAHQLSEIGVTLLMFGVGLHFSIRDLFAVRKVVIPGALIQIAVATLLGLGAAHLMSYPLKEGILFGLCLSVASTVVLLRALESRGEVESSNGRIAVGWLVVEDIVTIIAIVLLPVIAHASGAQDSGSHDGNLIWSLAEVLIKIAGFIGLMLIAGKRLLPLILGSAFRNGPRELFTLGIVAVALSLAFGAASIFEISPALGAFLAGVVLAESDLSHQTASEVKPLSTIFAVLFFVSIGMQFDPMVLLRHPIPVLAGLLIVIVGKSLASAAIMLASKYPPSAAMFISASLAQIGELSFILAGLCYQLGMLSQSMMSAILAVGVLSIALNPLTFSVMKWVGDRLGQRGHQRRTSSNVATQQASSVQHANELTDHVILVGYGRVGRAIATCFDETKVPYVVMDFDQTIARELQRVGKHRISGDASNTSDLAAAGIHQAKLLIVATPANSNAREIVEVARSLLPDLNICVRTHSHEDYRYFAQTNIQRIVLGELETAMEMADYAFHTMDIPRADSEEVIAQVRSELGRLQA